jgi:hypothetical protein
MKNILPILFLSLIVGFGACSGFLDENPRSTTTKEAFYKSEAQAVANVNTLYRTGVPSFYDAGSAYAGPTAMLGGYVSGYFDNEYAGQEVVVQYSKELNRTSVNIANQMDGVWDACYQAINIANGAIKYIPSISMDQTKANVLVGEAKFFRALNYFHLVKMFGDVPLNLEPYESLENLYVERTPVADVYKQIIADLKDAVSVLPNAAFYSNGNRITKNIANTVLASVYLQISGYPVQENHYADAADAAKAVINSKLHSLTPNTNLSDKSAFNILRTTDGLSESIYAYEFNSTVSNSGWWPTYSFPNAAAGWGLFKYSITVNVYRASNGLINVYDPNEDLRAQEQQFFFTKYKRPDTGVETSLGELCNWYYFDEDAMLNTGRGTKDFNIYRYSEVLLIAAEAIAQSNNAVTSEAAEYLAEVKARASLTGKSVDEIKAKLMTLSKDEFVKEVWAEKIRELPLEFKLWDDIIRTRQYPQFSASNKGKVTFINVIGASNNWGKTFEEKDLLWPLSANELQRNPALKQNPGYK